MSVQDQEKTLPERITMYKGWIKTQEDSICDLQQELELWQSQPSSNKTDGMIRRLISTINTTKDLIITLQKSIDKMNKELVAQSDSID